MSALLSTVRLEEFSDRNAVQIADLVYGILINEFVFSAASAEQPDLLDIPRHYGSASSNFWIALDGERVIGTIGFVDLSNGDALLRKMFVHSDYRGSGLAGLLLEKVLSWANKQSFGRVFLGTNSKFHAAHRFYEKNGFIPVSVQSLPDSIPRLGLRDQFFLRSLA